MSDTTDRQRVITLESANDQLFCDNLALNRQLSQLRADLSAAQARVKELEEERNAAQRSLAHYSHCYQGEHTGTCKYGNDDCPMRDISMRVVSTVTLQPRRCNRKCFVRVFEAAREAAAILVDDYAIDMLQIDGDELDSVIDRDGDMCNRIRSLTPPDSCDGCNPLAPDRLVDDLADALNDLKAKMGEEAWNQFIEMSHK